MSDDRPIVACIDVTRRFGPSSAEVVALRGVTCQVDPGRHIAIVGPSGSGKSTLLHLLAGLDQPTSGSVTWPALGDDPVLRPGPVAVVFQAPSLLPALDVIENVALPLVLDGVPEPEARARAQAALDALGLGSLSRKLPEEISGGQAQRVAVARALVATPRLLLADEPTGQLDGAAATEVTTALLETARRTGAALVVSTHDPAVASLLDVRWQMLDGRILDGSTEGQPCSR